MLDVAVAYNRYRFLGQEFLTWLWFMIDTDPGRLLQDLPQIGHLELGNRMVLENRRENSSEIIRITGDQAGLEEAMVALNKGALVSEMNLIYHTETLKWQFTLKGESLSISGLKIPELTPSADGADAAEDALLNKVYLIEKISDLLMAVFHQFVHLRLTDRWESGTIRNYKRWIASSINPSASKNDQ